MRYDINQRSFLLKKYHQLQNSTLVQRAWRTQFKNKKAPCCSTIERLAQRFENTGSVADNPPIQKKPSGKRQDAKEQLETLFSKFDNLSIRKAKRTTGISYGMIHRILKEDLHLKPYKEHEWHELQPGDNQKRLKFAEYFLDLPKNARFLLLACDEAYFYLHPEVNKQNNRRWLPSKPTDKIERPLHGEKVLVWCAISRDYIYGPYFFDENVNQQNYLNMLKNFFGKDMSLLVITKNTIFSKTEQDLTQETPFKATLSPSLEIDSSTRVNGHHALPILTHVTFFMGIFKG